VTNFSLSRRYRESAFARQDAWGWSMFLIVLAVSLFIIVLPGIIFWLSVREGRPIDPHAVYSFVHYIDVFTDSFVYEVLLNTLGFSIVTLVVALFFGLPTAWLAERTDLPGKSLLYTLMTIGLLMPGFAAAMGWLFLLHPRIGLINVWFIDWFGLASAPFNIASIIGMGWVQGLNLAPVAFIMTAAVFRAMDPSLEESAEMSGAKFGNIIRRITLPLAWPGILAAGIYIFTIGFAAFDVPAIIGWSNRIFTFSTYMVLQLNPDDELPEYGRAAALSTLVIFLAAALSWWYAKLQSQSHRYQVVTGKGYRPRIMPLRGYVYAAWGFLATYFILSKFMPFILLIWASVLPFFQGPSTEAFATMSLEHFRELPWDLAVEGIKNTAILMFLTPTITLALCVAFSWIVLRSKLPGRSFFDFVAFLPHAIPNIVFGVGILLFTLYIVRNAIPLYGTLWILLFVFVIARLSYGTRMTNSTLIQIHKDIEESATMSGASTGTVVLRVMVPLIMPTLIYAWLWIALLTFRELTLAIILTTRDNITLPVVVWSLWNASGFGQAAAITLVLIALMLPIIALYWWVSRRKGLVTQT
jgi:iron(III) transport system permease protein